MRILFFSTLLIIVALSACSKKRKTYPKYSYDFDKAQSLYNKKDDSAFFYFNKIVQDSDDSLQKGSAYHFMGWIQSDAGDYFGSQESILQSQQFFTNKTSTGLSYIPLNFDLLGTTSLNLNYYDEAIKYYRLALKTDPNTSNRSYYLNNMAVAYQRKKDYDNAINICQSAMTEKIDSIIEYARILSNFARSKWLKDSGYNAFSELHTALAIRKIKNDSSGLITSYSHLSDYYAITHRDSALFYARQMNYLANKVSSADVELDALSKMISSEDPVNSKKHFTRFLHLDDSLKLARNRAKNQFALVKFDSEKSKADNLVLQKDNSEKRSRINRQRLTIFAGLIIIASLIVIARLWYKKRKQQFLLESQNAVKEQQLKTSKKIHDVVANGLYQVMTEIEHKNIEKERLLDRIEVLYEKSRDISYETSSSQGGSYEEKINDLLSSFSNASVKVLIVGNNDNFWAAIPLSNKNELECILQELMVNMKKHSHARNVLIKFEHINDRFYLKYNDDGIGMGQDVKTGNGLKNTGNRIHTIGGIINFESSAGKGLKVDISFPKTTNDN